MENHQKPKILAVHDAAKTNLFHVEQVELEFSNGEMRTYERLKSAGRGAVMIIPVTKEGNLLLIREYGVGTERYELGFPKGAIDPGEQPAHAANRELQEEIGFKAGKLHLLREIHTSPNIMNSRMSIFVAEELTASSLEGDEPEPLEVVPYPITDIEQLLTSVEFSETKNLCALYNLRDFLKTRQP